MTAILKKTNKQTNRKIPWIKLSSGHVTGQSTLAPCQDIGWPSKIKRCATEWGKSNEAVVLVLQFLPTYWLCGLQPLAIPWTGGHSQVTWAVT